VFFPLILAKNDIKLIVGDKDFMSEITNIKQKEFLKSLNIKQEDLFEARFNLIGFFEVLYKIDQRLKKEKEEVTKDLEHKIQRSAD